MTDETEALIALGLLLVYVVFAFMAGYEKGREQAQRESKS